MRFSKLVIFIALFCVAALLFGCGGSNNNDNGVPTGLTGDVGTNGTTGALTGSTTGGTTGGTTAA